VNHISKQIKTVLILLKENDGSSDYSSCSAIFPALSQSLMLVLECEDDCDMHNGSRRRRLYHGTNKILYTVSLIGLRS